MKTPKRARPDQRLMTFAEPRLRFAFDQILDDPKDGLMLFARDSRVVLVSAPVERFLGRPRGELLGRTVKEVFTRDTPFGIMAMGCFNPSARNSAASWRDVAWSTCADCKSRR